MSQTNWKLYTSNEEAWQAMLETCEKSRRSIDLEQFIFVADDFGNKLIDICAKKAKEGVKVRFIWDAAGSFTFFGTGIIEKLKSQGIELVFFKNLFPDFFDIHNYKSWYFRNHRRTLIIDNKIGFTGSICVYERMKNWRDTNIRIEGSSVDEMNNAFERMWNRAHKKKNIKEKRRIDTRSDFKYITNSPIPRHKYLYKSLIKAIEEARKYIYITTPYFSPTRKLLKTLKRAREKNVEVKIILPERTDYLIVDLAARTFFHTMLKSGVKIYLYKDEIIHSKTIIIDGEWSTVGTLNLDHISLLYNFEANIVSTDKKFAGELLEHFEKDISRAEEVTLAMWRKRYWVEKFAGFFIRFIRDLL